METLNEEIDSFVDKIATSLKNNMICKKISCGNFYLVKNLEDPLSNY